MKVTIKKTRCDGTTTRLIGEACVNNGLYVAPTIYSFDHAQDIVRKNMRSESLKRLRTMRTLALNLPKDKATPLYFDEGCDINEVTELARNGYNVVEVIKGVYDIKGNSARLYVDEPAYIYSDSIQSGKISVPRTELQFSNIITGTLKVHGLSMIPKIKKIIYDIPNNTTIVYFEDDTKEVARVMDGDTFDKEVGVMQCIVKKMYGCRSKWLKEIVNKGVEVKPKKVKGE